MGQWGFYDDEGDNIAYFANYIQKMVLPERLQKCYRYDQVVKVPCNQIKNKVERAKLLKKIETAVKNPKSNISFHIAKTCSYEYQTPESIKCWIDARQYMLNNQLFDNYNMPPLFKDYYKHLLYNHLNHHNQNHRRIQLQHLQHNLQIILLLQLSSILFLQFQKNTFSLK